MAVAVDPGHGFRPFARPLRCKLQSYTQLDYKMIDFSQSKLTYSLKHAFEFTNIHKSFSTPCLSHSSRVEDESDTNARIEIIGGRATPRVRTMVVEVAIAMASGVNPEPVPNGLGGAYLLRTRNGDPIAVAKPIDEEPLAFNNPKGNGGQMFGQPGMKRSIKIGETGLRESAAYLLDHGGFAGVPPTVLVKFSHVKFNVNSSEPVLAPLYKIASLQRFVSHDSDAGDLGPSGNILVKQGQESCAAGKAELVPIDHGFCLPESVDDPYFEWLHWPQASIPFSESEVEYISSLDPFEDAELIRVELPAIRESSIRILVLCTIFLKQATAYGFCLADIAVIMMKTKFVRCSNLMKMNMAPIRDLDIAQNLKKFPAINDDDTNEDDNPKSGGLMRSVSFPAPKYSNDAEGISFGEMNDQEWELFLDSFEKLLPEAFEGRKSIGLPKQRLGSSCEF
ncbi:Protein kinase superfamily protein [Abeliophyllum distichum]|uniref:1-phosphatidylinositol 4-kinase n=1 Tax=Abeliophyllum distichum TaxID=126358 RepID=A0ABD1PQI4_9LAMI